MPNIWLVDTRKSNDMALNAWLGRDLFCLAQQCDDNDAHNETHKCLFGCVLGLFSCCSRTYSSQIKWMNCVVSNATTHRTFVERGKKMALRRFLLRALFARFFPHSTYALFAFACYYDFNFIVMHTSFWAVNSIRFMEEKNEHKKRDRVPRRAAICYISWNAAYHAI